MCSDNFNFEGVNIKTTILHDEGFKDVEEKFNFKIKSSEKISYNFLNRDFLTGNLYKYTYISKNGNEKICYENCIGGCDSFISIIFITELEIDNIDGMIRKYDELVQKELQESLNK